MRFGISAKNVRTQPQINEFIRYEPTTNQKIVEVMSENEKLKAEIKEKEQFEEINQKNKGEFEHLHHLKSHIDHL